MTRFIHDQFAKQYLTELLTPYGQVETSKDITAEVRQIDVLFIPSPEAVANLATLGLLEHRFINQREAVTDSVESVKILARK
jgi:hypothetical protein